VLIIISDLSYSMTCYVLLFLLQGKFNFIFYFTNVILPEAVYTILITCILYPVVLWINDRLEIREQRR